MIKKENSTTVETMDQYKPIMKPQRGKSHRNERHDSEGPHTEGQVLPERVPSKSSEDEVIDTLCESLPEEWVSSPLNTFNESSNFKRQHI